MFLIDNDCNLKFFLFVYYIIIIIYLVFNWNFLEWNVLFIWCFVVIDLWVIISLNIEECEFN